MSPGKSACHHDQPRYLWERRARHPPIDYFAASVLATEEAFRYQSTSQRLKLHPASDCQQTL